MTDIDPFADTSPWDETPPEQPTTAQESPMSEVPNTPAPFVVGMTLKGAAGYDAEWLTPKVYGHTATEAAKRTVELLTALKAEGAIDLTARAAEYTRNQYKGGGPKSGAAKSFEGGKVTTRDGGEPQGDVTCEHGRRNLVEKPTWKALFCPAPDKADQCEPAWFDKKTGKFKVK
ncbi:hypothetical protein [Embleya hyalina]|uniref:Uncharacterized protein n=1 Tax=Embleya hyalina TaxID=516124 RepID=A0A401YYY6_9ACTN|nr:hypothetical protein [Embleya hyalina]GCD99839.1 hypothetical protein EHYA_07561 [Embleya hyalina]